jgi:hypothetical protein
MADSDPEPDVWDVHRFPLTYLLVNLSLDWHRFDGDGGDGDGDATSSQSSLLSFISAPSLSLRCRAQSRAFFHSYFRAPVLL